MSDARRIHWGLILLAGFLAEVSIMVVFFTLLAAAALAGVPELARPESALDLIEAVVSSTKQTSICGFLGATEVGAAFSLANAWSGRAASREARRSFVFMVFGMD